VTGVRIALLNGTDDSLQAVVEPFYSERTIEPGGSALCSFSVDATAYVAISRSRSLPLNGVWLHPSPGAPGTFCPSTSDDLIGVRSGSTRRRRDAWPLGPHPNVEDAVGLFIDDDAVDASLEVGGQVIPLSGRHVWIDGAFNRRDPVRLTVTAVGFLLTGLEAVRSSQR
jgi:hypothetical protein